MTNLPHRPLGMITPVPSAICLGAGSYGSGIPQDAAFAILDAFADQGGNFVDTARVYGAWLPNGAGLSERVVGAWLAARGMRKQFVVGTKGAHPELATMHISRLAPQDIAADLEASLQALQTDWVDLYWLHRDDTAVPVGEIMAALHVHVASGRVRAIGASNWSVDRLTEANAYAATHGLTPFSASQIGWSLARSNPAAQVFPGTLSMDAAIHTYHCRSGLPVLAYSSQAQGFFSGRYRADGPAPVTPKEKSIARNYDLPDNWARLARAQELAARYGRTANEIALAYLLSQPFAVFPIVGCGSVDQVHASCAAHDLLLTDDELAYLEGGSLPSRRK